MDRPATPVHSILAAGKPIVSTPITDVAVPYGDVVYLGDTPQEFIAACERALADGPEEQARRAKKMAAILARTSWDSTVAAMEELVDAAVEKGRPKSGSVRLDPAHPGAFHRRGVKAPVIVAGAGPTGLSAAYHLGDDALLIEQNATVGGWRRSIQEKGFTFDFAGHIMFSNDPYVHELYKMLLGENVHWQAYVVYDHARPKNVATVRAWLAEHDVLLAGRYSEWEYYNSDHAFLAGKKAADKVFQLRRERVGVAV
jgi:UDP-galactopyranose mutase